MNENGYDSNQQYSNGYDQQYGGNGYDQQYSNGYDSIPQVHIELPEGLMSRLPESWKDKLDDLAAKAEQESRNMARYGHIEPYEYRSHRHPLVSFAVMAIGLGGAFFFVFIRPEYMLALICFGIPFLVFGIGYVIDKNYSFRKAPTYALILLLGIIFISVAAYHLLAENNPSLPQPESQGIEVWVCGLFIIVGAGLLILESISYICMKKICTEPVSGLCVYVKRREERSGRNNSTTTKFSAVFEYQYRGNTYYAAEPFGNNDVPHTGDICELYLNPSDPTDFYRKSWKALVSSLIGSILFIALPILILLYR